MSPTMLWLAHTDDDAFKIKVVADTPRTATLIVVRRRDSHLVAGEQIDLKTSVAFSPDTEDINEWKHLAGEIIDRFERGVLA